MKNLQKLFSMAMLVGLTVTMFSCSKDDEVAVFAEADIMGTWRISSSDLKLNGVSDDNISSWYEEGSTIEIMEDKKYEISKDDRVYEEGTWSFDGKSTLTLTDSSDDATPFQIKSLNKEAATLYSYEEESLLGFEIKSEQTINLKK